MSITSSIANGKLYQAAIAALNSLQTNYAIVEALRKSTTRQEMNDRSLPETIEWLQRIGYKVCRYCSPLRFGQEELICL